MPSTATAPPAKPTGAPPQTVTLPRTHFAALAPASYLTAHLQPLNPSLPPIRPTTGRSPSTFRPPSCTTGSLTHCSGSAVVRIGDTAVVCGVQAELLLAKDIPHPPRVSTSSTEKQDSHDDDDGEGERIAALHLLVPNVELATGCDPHHLPGGAPSEEAQALSARLLSLLTTSGMVRMRDLEVTYTPPAQTDVHDDDADTDEAPRTVAYWTLYPSIHVLSLAGGEALFDAAWGALVAALRDVRLPKAWWDADVGAVVCSESVADARRLELKGRPVAATWGVFVAEVGEQEEGVAQGSREMWKELDIDGSRKRAWLLADPDGFEGELCEEVITVVLDYSIGRGTTVLRIEKSGGGVVGMKEMKRLVQRAEHRWQEWDAVLP